MATYNPQTTRPIALSEDEIKVIREAVVRTERDYLTTRIEKLLLDSVLKKLREGEDD